MRKCVKTQYRRDGVRRIAYKMLPAVIGLVVGVTAMARADGKIFWRERVPPGIPYQRALILFDEGTETLVVQSKYELPGPDKQVDLGWVVPLPGVPELASMDADRAKHLFMLLGLFSGPKVTRIRDIISIIQQAF